MTGEDAAQPKLASGDHAPRDARRKTLPFGVPLVFAASGFAALLYQVVWQRALFNIYGINIESVTLVVTSFMLGLGLGSLLGGMLSKRPQAPLIRYFALAEFLVGLFGFFSLSIFRWAGSITADMSLFGTGLASFLLVLLPTLLMGATLPLLVSYAVQRVGNVGQSVGMLYFVNTLGSALAAGASVLWIMGNLGMRGSVNFAATINLLVAMSVLALERWRWRP